MCWSSVRGIPPKDISKTEPSFYASSSQSGQIVRIRRSSDGEHSNVNVDDIGFGLLTSSDMIKTQVSPVETTGVKRSSYTVKDKDFGRSMFICIRIILDRKSWILFAPTVITPLPPAALTSYYCSLLE